MMNYIKSELYRASHDKGIYTFTGILAVLCVLFNLIIYGFGIMDGPSFRYNTVSFSFSNLVANPMIFCLLGFVIAMILYDSNRRNGNLKNTISFGVARTEIFTGECLVATLTATIIMVILLIVYIPATFLLLKHQGPVQIVDLLTEIPAVFLVAVASIISGILCLEAFGKESTGIIVWVVIWLLIPKVFFYLGLRFDIIYHIAMWMPSNMFGTSGMVVNMSQCITAWGTAAGMAKCIVSGILGILIFSLWGVLVLRRKEL